MLKKLIRDPRNAKERKEAPRRAAAALEHIVELERIGGQIFRIENLVHELRLSRHWLIARQTEIAVDLRKAGVEMEGNIVKPRPADPGKSRRETT